MWGKSRMGEEEEKERRQKVRLHKIIPAEFIFFSDLIVPDTPKVTKGLIYNFSAAGICAEIKNMEEIDIEALYRGVVKVGIKANFPSPEEEVKVLARAVWVRDKTGEERNLPALLMGLKFIDITMAAENLLEEYIINFYIESINSYNL